MNDDAKAFAKETVGFLRGGGEMAALMRSFDFSTTPLGAASEWPQRLRSAVSICFDSRFPIVLFWGTRRRTHEGTGTGLALGLVQLHGGMVHAESNMGEGSLFTITLPFWSAHLPAEQIGGTRTDVSTALGIGPLWKKRSGGCPINHSRRTTTSQATF